MAESQLPDGFRAIRCEFCGAGHTQAFNEENPHVCTVPKLRERVTQLRTLAESTLKVLAIEFAWTFTLEDGVGVKVEFHGTPSAKHVQAFAKVFSVIAENYAVTPQQTQINLEPPLGQASSA